jgi:hypothetical protein
MWIGNVNFVRIAVFELEQDSPSPIYVDRPETPQIALEFVQSDTVELTERIKRGSCVQFRKALACKVLIEPGEP